MSKITHGPTMNNPCRAYAQAAFAKALGAGPVARNCEISVLNWTRTQVSLDDSSWESRKFRDMYKFKTLSLLKALTYDPMIVPKITVCGDRVKVSCSVVPSLIHKIKTKRLDSRRIAWYSSDILWPDGPYAKVIAKLKADDMRNEAFKAKEADYEGILQCRKCKSKKTEYYQLQTRSADEPMVCFSVFFLNFTNSQSDNIRHMQELRT